MDPDEILTGEGVALSVQAASVLARAGAWLLDAIVMLAALFGLSMLMTVGGGNLDNAMATAYMMLVSFMCFIGIPTLLETLTHGRSVGKLAFGIQVIRDDGGPVRLRHAAIRSLIGFFELWASLGGIAFIVSMLNDRGKRVGDFLAGTYAANVRGAKTAPLAISLPPSLADWVKVTDIRPLPDALAMRARQFLQRANTFPVQARNKLGLRVAAQLEQYVAPSPPPWTHPEAFITAVLYERRRREQESTASRIQRVNQQLAGIETLPYSVADPVL
ncbi:MAG: RDD family protein [Propionibacteriaceae bacterium]|jgi:uncharacterized RDD family membrane protein YckC|nr:RDD family protein [Propionibacteriaceae bacterium]